MHVMLDISRLLSSAWRGYPSGIDRVEYAYARHWRRAPADQCTFVASSLAGGFQPFPRRLACALLDALAQSLTEGARGGPGHQRARALAAIGHALLLACTGSRALARQVRNRPGSVLVAVSHRSIGQARAIEALRKAGAAFVPLIHDLIPLTHPEYSRPEAGVRHRTMLHTVSRAADAVIVNSGATRQALADWMGRNSLRCPPLTAAPLGFDLPDMQPDACLRPREPYFVMLGTIEPRKNHIFLLSVWRDLHAEFGQAAPRLVIIGREGWESEAVKRMLERRRGFDGLVESRGRVSDQDIAWLLGGARALLFPSMAEGYGIPLVEALSLGIPVIGSDIPALREVGGQVPELLHPLDGPGWRQAILDYMQPDSSRRREQLERLARWRRPNWDDHFRMVEGVMKGAVLERNRPATGHSIELPEQGTVATAGRAVS